MVSFIRSNRDRFLDSGAALARAAEILRGAGIESGRLDARLLLAHSLARPADEVFGTRELTAAQAEAFDRLIARRAAREPLAYITGTREFWSLPFAVGPGVLVPRPETETLVEEALRDFGDLAAPLRVLDIGTGSGCLLCAFLMERRNATGIGVDVSGEALSYAAANLRRHGLDGRSRLFECPWAPPGEAGFDVIVANPPYLTGAEFEAAAPEIREHEPRAAFVAGRDGLDAVRTLASILPELLNPSGLAYVEIGAGQRTPAGEILGRSGLEVWRAVPDLSGVPRCLVIGRADMGGAQAPPKNSVGKELATR